MRRGEIIFLRSHIGAVAKLAEVQQLLDSLCKRDLYVLSFLAWPNLRASSSQPARGELLQLRGWGGEVASETAIIILFTGKRVSEWPNLLAVPDLYEIYEA